MSGSFESIQWDACMHILDLSLHSHLKEYSMVKYLEDLKGFWQNLKRIIAEKVLYMHNFLIYIHKTPLFLETVNWTSTDRI